MNVAEVQELKNLIDKTNTELEGAKYKLQLAEERKQELLESCGVKSVEELDLKIAEKEKEMAVLVVAARAYVDSVMPQLEIVRQKLQGV